MDAAEILVEAAPEGAGGGNRQPSIPVLAHSLWQQVQPSRRDAETAPLCMPLALVLARHLRFDAADPLWPDRDRLVLAPELAALGEAAAGLLGSGPGLYHTPSQALGTTVGLALAERMLAARFGRSLVDHRSWMLGLGEELASGPVQEAASLAGQWRLTGVTVITAVGAHDARGLAGFAASGWAIRRINAGQPAELAAAISAAYRSSKPTLIACLTGEAEAGTVPLAEPPSDAASASASASAWAACGCRNAALRRSWLKRRAKHGARKEFDHAIAGRLPPGWQAAMLELSTQRQGALSTAQAVQMAIACLSGAAPGLALLPGEPGWASMQPVPALQLDVCRQLVQGAAAAMTGLALHGGLVPLAAHRLDQADRVQPALADSARAGARRLEVLIESATPCPVACHSTGLRAMRNLSVFRPANPSEAWDCLELALRRQAGPSVLLLSEHPPADIEPRPVRMGAAQGGYVAAESAGPRAATLVAAGRALGLALQARTMLAASGITVAVVSLPCWDLFAAQDAEWRARTLGDAPLIGVEESSGFGWARWLGPDGLFVGLDTEPETSTRPARCSDAAGLAVAVRRYLARSGSTWTPATGFDRTRPAFPSIARSGALK